MTSTNPKLSELSTFGKAAVALDGDFAAFERLAKELERLPLNSDRGLDRARALLGELDGCRQRIASGMKALASTLDEARGRTEKAAQIVTEREVLVFERQREAEQMLQRFKVLGEMVGTVTKAVGEMRQTKSGGLSEEEHAALVERMPEFNKQLGVLVDEARKLMEDAHAANMKALERNADSLRQSLQSALHRLNQLADRGRPATPPH